jgi:hypothetical protein
MNPDGCRAMAVDLLTGALADLEHAERRAGAVRWVEGGRAPLGFAAACELARLDVDAVRDRLKDRLNGGQGVRL